MIDRRLAVTDLFFTARVTEAPAPADAYSYVATPLSSVNRGQFLWSKNDRSVVIPPSPFHQAWDTRNSLGVAALPHRIRKQKQFCRFRQKNSTRRSGF